jgi:hypothetical protein
MYRLNKSPLKFIRQKVSTLMIGLITIVFPASVFLASGGTAAAATPFTLVPFEFVGTASDCGGTAGTDTVTAQWDSSTGNPSPSLLLQKLGATSNCAAAGVDIITPLEGGPVSSLTELNFDYKNSEHCGAGSPRFNIQTNTGTAVLLGCNTVVGTRTPTGNAQWTHLEFSPTDIAAALATVPGSTTLQDLYIIADEGSDTGPDFTGTSHIDNISVNGGIVGSPTTPTNKNDCKNGGFANFTDNNGNTFKNQGQCVAFVNGERRTAKVVNNNRIVFTNTNTQSATTGNAKVKNNTTGGNATSGNASNSNSTTNSVNVSNNPTF